VNWGELWHYPFLTSIWGTVPSWAGGVSLIAGSIYFIADRRRDRRAQASLIAVDFDESAQIVIKNRSYDPIVDVTVVRKAMSLWSAARMDGFRDIIVLGNPPVGALSAHEFYVNAKSTIGQIGRSTYTPRDCARSKRGSGVGGGSGSTGRCGLCDGFYDTN
jgi:hypothetical protein